jgi:sugar lactone lactonase YvrE
MLSTRLVVQSESESLAATIWKAIPRMKTWSLSESREWSGLVRRSRSMMLAIVTYIAMIAGLTPFVCPQLEGQSTIGSYAGAGVPDGVAAKGAGLLSISSIAPLSSGDVYFSSEGKLFRISSIGTLTVARSDFRGHVSAEPSKTMLIADPAAGTVTRFDPSTGQSTTIAGIGSGSTCPLLQGQLPSAAILCQPTYAVSDASGIVYINSQVDSGCFRPSSAISRVSSSMINTIAVADSSCPLPDQSFFVNQFGSLATDANGNLFFIEITKNVPGGEYQSRETESFSASIMKIGPGGQLATVYAGSGVFGFSGDGGLATAAQLNNPTSLAVDPSGFVYVADFQNHRIRRVDPTTGIITTFAGNLTGIFADGVPPTSTRILPTAISFLDRDLFVADGDLIRTISGSTGLVQTVAGNAANAASHIRLGAPVALGIDSSSNIFVADQDVDESVFLPVGGLTPADRIRMIDRRGGATHLAGDFSAIESGDTGPAAQAGTPVSSIVLNPMDDVYIAKGTFPSTTRMIDRNGQISVTSGVPGAFIDPGGGFINCGGPMPLLGCPLGDGGPAANAFLTGAVGVATDSVGNLFVCDGNRIRRIDAISQVISTIGGTGSLGDSGDGGAAVQAMINCSGIAVDLQGNILLSEPTYHRVRRIDALTGFINAYAGDGLDGYAGDGGTSIAAALSAPRGISFDTSGNVYIADAGNSTVRRVDNASGLISTVAGIGSPGFSGDGGPGNAAALNQPSSVVFDGFGNLLIADTGNNRIRILSQLTPLSISPWRLYFGAQTVGTASSPQSVTVSNIGAANLMIQSLQSKGDAASDYILTDGCSGQMLNAGKTCVVDLLFEPKGSKARAAWLAITAVGASSVQLPLGGLGRDFEIALADISATISAGQKATYRLDVTPVVGFSGPVSMNCTGQPEKSLCSFDNSTFTLDGKNQMSVTLTIETTAPVTVATLRPFNVRTGTSPLYAMLLLYGVGALSFLNRRRTAIRALAIALIIGLASYGCGSTGSTTVPGTPPGTYSITVTAQSGTLTHSAGVTLVVQ